MALHLVGREAGPEVAQAVQLGIEYDPQPPFDAGSPAKAPAPIVELVTRRRRRGDEWLGALASAPELTARVARASGIATSSCALSSPRSCSSGAAAGVEATRKVWDLPPARLKVRWPTATRTTLVGTPARGRAAAPWRGCAG